MSVANWVAAYYRTKYRFSRLSRSFSIPKAWKVLDIGSGDSPFPPADVVCEKFPFDDTERTAAFRIDRPLVVGDAEALPFKDKSFDFIYASHILEHVDHPELAIRELMRVGMRGYIEMPRSYFEKTVMSTGSHLWFVSLEDGVLVFKPKPSGILDEEINATYEKLIDRDPLFSAFYYSRIYDLFHVGLQWEGDIRFRVERSTGAREDVAEPVYQRATLQGSPSAQKAPRRQTSASLIKHWIRQRAQKKDFDLTSILACPACKGVLEVRTPGEKLRCGACRLDYEYRHGAPVLLRGTENDRAQSEFVSAVH